jgi:hypothetical protein
MKLTASYDSPDGYVGSCAQQQARAMHKRTHVLEQCVRVRARRTPLQLCLPLATTVPTRPCPHLVEDCRALHVARRGLVQRKGRAPTQHVVRKRTHAPAVKLRPAAAGQEPASGAKELL